MKRNMFLKTALSNLIIILYKRYLSNGETIRGEIFYENFKVILKDKKSNLQMDFLVRNIMKDTILFGTKDLRESLMIMTLYFILEK